jgi:polysaccharide biosynthesis transport protein
MEEKEINLRHYFSILIKRKNTIFTVFVVVFAISLLVTLSSTPIYTATTRILIERNDPAPLQGMYYFVPYDPEFYETQYQLIKSGAVARRVVGLLSTDDRFEKYFKNKKKGFFKSAGAEDKTKDKEQPDDPKNIDKYADIISSGIKVLPIKNTKLADVKYNSPDPEFAALIANTVARAYIEEILDMKMSSSRHTVQWMTKKADEEQEKLKKSELALQEYVKANNFVTLENKVAIVPEKLTSVNTQLFQAETDRKELETLYNKIRDTKNVEDLQSMPAIASDPTIQSLHMQILKSDQNIAELSKKYGAKHPAMAKAKGELETLRNKRRQEIQRVIESIKKQYEIAGSNEENSRRLFSRTKGEALNVNEKFVQYNIRKREVETNQQLYDILMKKIKEQNITQEVQSVNVWIIEEARPPRSTSKPNKPYNLLLGLILGMFGGVGLAFFVDYLDNTVKSPDEVERRLNMPVLGMVPIYKSKEWNIENIVLKKPNSPISESYKSIRSSILLSAADHPPKKLLITSMLPEEGKTVTSVNLALALAQSEFRVLLLDADMRKPRIHKIFKLDNSVGLSSFLAGISDIHIHEKYESSVKNLSIIPSGPVPPNPSELLGSAKMNELFKTLSEKFDIIICDSPPIMTVTDGTILSKIVEGTIIVTRVGKTTYEAVRRGLKSLEDIKAHVIGIVINAFDAEKNSYYYYRYRSYNYYYLHDEDMKK